MNIVQGRGRANEQKDHPPQQLMKQQGRADEHIADELELSSLSPDGSTHSNQSGQEEDPLALDDFTGSDDYREQQDPNDQPICPVPVVPLSRNRKLENDLANLTKAETHWGCFGVGEKVFAFWKGKTAFSTGYYSGTIIKKGVLNVYNIHFDDDTVSNTSEVQILPIRVLGVGVKVFYLPDESTTGPMSAVVVGQKFSGTKADAAGDEVQYAIQVYGSTEVIMCERRQLYLGMTPAKELRKKYESVQPKLGDLNLDNIVTGPRRRGRASESADTQQSKSLSENDDVPARSPSRNRKVRSVQNSRNSAVGNSRKRARVNHCEGKNDGDATTEPPAKIISTTAHFNQNMRPKSAKPSSESTTPPPTPDEPKVQKDNASVQVVGNSETEPQKADSVTTRTESNPPTVTFAKPKTKSKAAKDDVQSATEKEPLFRGYYFYLTSGDRDLIRGMGMGNYSKEIPKLKMLNMLKSQGGTELCKVGEEEGKNPERVFLLASSHLRTLKYLYCVARGIPCIAQTWIEHSIAANKVLDWQPYRLSPGWCVEEGRLGEVHANFPLEGMRIGLATFKDETINTWKVLVPAAKASIVISKDFHHDRQPAELKLPDTWLKGEIDILVSDFHCPPELSEMLKSEKIPLVRIEWLVQTIIMGKKAHLKVGDLGNCHYELGA